MRNLFLLFFTLCSYVGFAQSDSLAITPPRRYPPSCDCFEGMIDLTPRLAYTYADAKSSHFAGLMLHNDCIACGGGFYAGVHFAGRDSHRVVPEVGAEFYHLLLGYGVSLSTEAITPRVGLSFFNLLRVDAGYAIPWAKAPLFKGFTLSIITDIRLLSYPLLL